MSVKGLAHQFYMQFDTGAPHSYIYENSLKSIRALGIEINEVVKHGNRFVETIRI